MTKKKPKTKPKRVATVNNIPSGKGHARHANLLHQDFPLVSKLPPAPPFEDADIVDTITNGEGGDSIPKEIETLGLKLKDLESVLEKLQSRLAPACVARPKKTNSIMPEDDSPDLSYRMSRMFLAVFELQQRVGKLTADVQDSLSSLQI